MAFFFFTGDYTRTRREDVRVDDWSCLTLTLSFPLFLIMTSFLKSLSEAVSQVKQDETAAATQIFSISKGPLTQCIHFVALISFS